MQARKLPANYSVELISSHQLNPTEWELFLQHCPQSTVFAQIWFLDLVWEKDWSILLVRYRSEIIAAFPFATRRKWGIAYALQPPLTKYLGPFWKDFSNIQSLYEIYHQKQLLVELIVSNLPKQWWRMEYYTSPEFDYPLPFYWNQWQLQVGFTYRISLQQTEQFLFNNAKKLLLKTIRQKVDFGFRFSDAISEVINIIKANAIVGKELIPYWQINLFEKIINAAMQRSAGFIFVPDTQNPPAAAVCLTDNNGIYLLLGCISPEHKKQKPWLAALILELLKQNLGKKIYFDFLGSMSEGIESFFRSFGAKPVPYYR
ncbi:MAG: hypothetical protein NZ108_09530, partial [Bacteroidia bacterium]|nr:hypothetical protein [Bacteroidia bacterium]